MLRKKRRLISHETVAPWRYAAMTHALNHSHSAIYDVIKWVSVNFWQVSRLYDRAGASAGCDAAAQMPATRARWFNFPQSLSYLCAW